MSRKFLAQLHKERELIQSRLGAIEALLAAYSTQPAEQPSYGSMEVVAAIRDTTRQLLLESFVGRVGTRDIVRALRGKGVPLAVGAAASVRRILLRSSEFQSLGGQSWGLAAQNSDTLTDSSHDVGTPEPDGSDTVQGDGEPVISGSDVSPVLTR